MACMIRGHALWSAILTFPFALLLFCPFAPDPPLPSSVVAPRPQVSDQPAVNAAVATMAPARVAEELFVVLAAEEAAVPEDAVEPLAPFVMRRASMPEPPEAAEVRRQ